MSLAVLAAMTAGAAGAQVSDAQSQAVDAVFARYAGTAVPGCAVAVAKDGRTILDRAYGMADLETGTRATPASIYESGSVSKQFTAAAILLLARDGKLRLDDDIRKYLPEMPDYGAPVTVGQLIHHTSGLRDWGAVAAMSGWPRNSRVADNADVLALAAQQRGLNYPPGAHYTYSNTNFNLAAIIVARVSGQSFAAFTDARILRPLGMKDSSWRENYARVVPGRATAYARDGGAYVIDQPIEDAHGNGGLLTTTADMIRWNAALDADTLGPGFTAEMEKVGVLSTGTKIEYAAGLRVTQRDGRREVAHSGSTGGYRAWLGRYPAEKLSVALLCNASDANPVDSGRRVADAFLPKTAAVARAAGPLPTGGVYLSGLTGLPVEIAVRGATLTADGATLTPAGAGRWQRGDATYVFDAKDGLTVEAVGDRVRYVRATPPSAANLEGFAGRYCGVDNDFCLIVTWDETGALSFIPSSRPGMAAQPLTPLFADGFAAGNRNVLRFQRDGAGRVTGLRYHDDRAYGVEFARAK
ncbi:serine hydrolase domain-containing protein [Sphingomonas sp.]|uniref:serine hydrolase domain-containing protein n=1 Tax=Sphingomonas sp. TaxID=28214 RepID=UPI002DD686BD|nr:serine hydrolase domain-containing protein [Sphingomonas sp.]